MPYFIIKVKGKNLKTLLKEFKTYDEALTYIVKKALTKEDLYYIVELVGKCFGKYLIKYKKT